MRDIDSGMSKPLTGRDDLINVLAGELTEELGDLAGIGLNTDGGEDLLDGSSIGAGVATEASDCRKGEAEWKKGGCSVRSGS